MFRISLLQTDREANHLVSLSSPDRRRINIMSGANLRHSRQKVDPEGMIIMSVSIPQQIYDRVEYLSEKYEISKAAIIMHAFKQGIEKTEHILKTQGAHWL